MDQAAHLLAPVTQKVFGAVQTLDRWYAQELSYVGQQLNRYLGINPYASNSALNTAISQSSSDTGFGRGNSSGSGSGKGTLTTPQNTNSQTLNSSTQQSGRGSGSGSGTMNHVTVSKQGFSKVHSLTSPGSGTGSGTAGSGTGSVGNGVGSGYANVSGRVWLDNDGDGQWDNNELGYQGITVDLEDPTTTPWSLVQTTTTNSSGGYAFTPLLLGPQAKSFLVHVELNGWNATYPGVNQINNYGNSQPFLLRAGGWRAIEAGLLSMTVTTVKDDPNQPIQNQITLRDAIKTGNNGGGPLGLHNITFYDFPEKELLSGIISLQKALDPIARSYDISGPGSSTLTVEGGGQANPFRIFDINAGVTSTISGLTITGGYVKAQNGGGISNAGKLTLSSDRVFNNTAAATSSGDGHPVGGLGGGIYNNSDGNLTLSGTNVSANTAPGGGGIANEGTLTTTTGIASEIVDNISAEGGGIANVGNLASAKIYKATTIVGNFASVKGGGLFNSLGEATISGSGATSEEIYHNKAPSGGGIYVANGTLTLNSFVTINTNTATAGDGGGMFLADGSTTNFNNVIVTGNTATGKGAGIAYQKDATLSPKPPTDKLTDKDDAGGPVQV